MNGRANADAAHTLQVNEAGNVFDCLLQNDVDLIRRRPPARCTIAR